MLRVLRAHGFMRVGFLRPLTAVFLLFAAAIANADPQKLLQLSHRPTIAEVIAELTPWPETNPFIVSNGHQVELPPALEQDLAKTIATLELLYPGATFAPLGRDVVWLGDAIDAFYTSIGQPGRVSRLNASGNTLNNNEISYTDFLESAGVNSEDLANSPPFVGFDRTSLSPGQLGRIFSAMYKKLLTKYGIQNAELIAQKINLFALNGSATAHLKVIGGAENAIALRQAQINDLKRGMNPSQFASIPYASNGYLVDSTLFWHGPFGTFTTVNGRYQGALGNPSHGTVRVACLQFMYNLLTKLSDPNFLSNVQAEARKLGYEFPLQRVVNGNIERVKFKVEDQAVPYRQQIQSLPVIAAGAEQPKYFTPNGRIVAKWYDDFMPIAKADDAGLPLTMLFLEGVIVAKKAKQLTGKDYRRLIAKALAGLDTTAEFSPSAEFADWFRRTFENESGFRDAWLGRSDYFLDEDPARRGGLSVPKIYRQINRLFGIDPQPPTDCATAING